MKKIYCFLSFSLITVLLWSQEYKIIPNDFEFTHWFGSSIAIDGEYAIAGAIKDHTNGYGTGAAYIFKKEDTTWVQQAKLLADDSYMSDRFGFEVDISGNIALVGADGQDPSGFNSGAVYAFILKDGEWQFMSKIFPEDNEAIDFFGAYISMHNDHAVISSRGDDDAGENFGSVYIYQRVDSIWEQRAKFTPNPNTSKDYSYGQALAINDEFAVVGSHKDFTDSYFHSGTVYVYRNVDNEWVFDSQLSPETPFERAQFGMAVAINGHRVLVGAPGAKVDGIATGAAYLFEYTDNKWEQTAMLTVPNAQQTDYIGFHVAISGQNIFINNSEQEGFVESGEVYWFREINGNWVFQQTIKASDNKTYNRYAFRGIDFSENNLIVAAITDKVMDFRNVGSAYIYNICELMPEGLDLYKYNLSFRPNPTYGPITIDFPKACAQADAIVYDAKGSLVGKYIVTDSRLDLSGLPAALYFVKIKSPENEFIFKVSKN